MIGQINRPFIKWILIQPLKRYIFYINIDIYQSSLGQEDPLEEGTATYSSILTWRNPMDGGAWWAIVHGVIKSRIHLK